MTSFTPGPWYSRPHTLRPSDAVVACSAGVVAEVLDGEADPEQIANVALLTAAPDLYEAVKLLLPLAIGYAPEGQTKEARASCERRISAARDALAKAASSQTEGTPQAQRAQDETQ